MANIKSAKKRIRVIKRKTAVNRRRKNEVRTYIRKFNDALDNGNIDKAKELFRVVEKKITRAAAKGTIHKNAASKKVSRLAKRLNKAV